MRRADKSTPVVAAAGGVLVLTCPTDGSDAAGASNFWFATNTTAFRNHRIVMLFSDGPTNLD